MIAKVGSSTSVYGTLNYLDNDPERVDWKEGVHLADTEKEFVREQMLQTAELSRTDKPIYHYSLSWDPSDDPSKQQMIDAAKFTLKQLGMEDHQALIVAHKDHEYKHVHVMANRVHPIKGTAWDRWRDYKKLEQSLRVLERSHNWREVPGHHHQLEGQKEPEYGQAVNRLEAEQLKRAEKPLFLSIREVAMNDFRQAKSWKDLHNRLAEVGLTIQRGSRGTGGKITDGHEYTNLSKVHRDFSMKKLEQRFGRFKSLDELQTSKSMTPQQKQFLQFERAYRLNQKTAEKHLRGISKNLKAKKTLSQLNNTIKSFRALTTASNPALGIVNKIAGKLITAIKKELEIQHQKEPKREREQERGLSL